MSEPSITDWISAASAVVQTVGALLAIGVTAFIARQSERSASDRERQAIEREAAARIAADARAEAAIQQAAEAEASRSSAARQRVAGIAIHALEIVTRSIDVQLEEIRALPMHDASGDLTTISMGWTAAETASTTLRALSSRADDPMLATLLEQGTVTLTKPEDIAGWYRDSAERYLSSVGREIEHLIVALRSA